MTSIPQLRKDINDLQEKLRVALARVRELEAAPKPPVDNRPVVYVDNPDHIAMIEKLRGKLNANRN
jgi:DNA-directed RNA polymerase subunit K/omega